MGPKNPVMCIAPANVGYALGCGVPLESPVLMAGPDPMIITRIEIQQGLESCVSFPAG